MNEKQWVEKSKKCKGRKPDGYANRCEISCIEGFEGSVHSVYCNYNFCDRLKYGRDWYETPQESPEVLAKRWAEWMKTIK